ncbi:MAG: AbrB/MazE/SpoVT family DNA-binding domain-containing protein [Crenarchaeota archaeon]|nr:AbrB/MazE/SpoVT family DNA-binding domain-containing protein [Thermoproteota archaeon]
MSREERLSEDIVEDVEFRKLQLLGRSSVAVTIPKKWVQFLGLKPGDVVILKRSRDGIVIQPYSQSEETGLDTSMREVTVSTSQLARSLRRLMGLYLSGSSSVVVKFQDDNPGIKQVVKSFIREKLPGAEIVDERYNMMIVRFLTNLEELPIRRILKRMSNMAINMLREGLRLLTADREETVIEQIPDSSVKDEEIDRLYLLVYRLVNQGVLNQKLLTKLEIEDPRELIAALIVAKSIERCGDHATRVIDLSKAILSINVSISLSNDVFQKLTELGHSACYVLREATQSFVEKDVDRAHEILEKRLELRKVSIRLVDNLMKHACPLCMVKANELLTYVILLIESIRRFLAYSYDIAEITIDTYSHKVE